jgi:hypothetical protein
MQGISLLTDPNGQPAVLTIDLRNLTDEVSPLVAGLLELLQQQDEEQERREWVASSLYNLNRAYGDDEPEYTDEDLVWKNPDFKPL